MSGLEVYHGEHVQQYTVVPHTLSRDTRISLLAHGTLVYLLSLPDGWHVTADAIASLFPDGRKAVRSAMAELRDAGYTVLHVEHDEHGRWRKRLQVFDTPGHGQNAPVSPDASTPRLVRPAETAEKEVSPQVAPDATRPAAGRVADKRSTGKKKSPSARVASIVRSAFPDATDEEIEGIERTVKGEHSPANVGGYIAAMAENGDVRLPCGPERTEWPGPRSRFCLGEGNDRSCPQVPPKGWCRCRCHVKPLRAAAP